MNMTKIEILKLLLELVQKSGVHSNVNSYSPDVIFNGRNYLNVTSDYIDSKKMVENLKEELLKLI